MEGTPYNNQPSLAKPNENKAGTYTLIGCLGCAGLLALGLVFVGVIALIGASSPSRPASASPSAVASSHMPEEATPESTAAQPPAEEKKEEPPQNTHTTTKKNTRTVTIEATASGSGNASYGGSGSHNTAKFENSWSYTEEISKSDYYAVSVSGDIFNSDELNQRKVPPVNMAALIALRYNHRIDKLITQRSIITAVPMAGTVITQITYNYF